MVGKRVLDHIVYAVSDLAQACGQIEKLLGVKPVFGGYHRTQGTKNALIGLNQGMYLELLAIDETNKDITLPRWMGVDLLTKSQITRWAIKSTDLNHDAVVLQQANPEMGERSGGSRKTADGSFLAWSLCMPLASPEVEILPFIIDWSTAESHPSDQLSIQCRLVELYAKHPDPQLVEPTLEKLNVSLRIERSETISLKAKIECPKGIVVL